MASRSVLRAVLVGLSLGVLATAQAGLYDETVMADNPVAYWRLGEAVGSATVYNFVNPAQYSGTVFAGTTLGQPGAPLSDPNTAALFNGSTGKIDVAYNAALNPASYTIECWARLAGGAGSYRSPLTSRDDSPQRGYIFYAEPGNRWQFWTGTGTGWHASSGPGGAFGDWAHLVGTYDAATSTKRFYVNGALVSTATTAQGLNTARPLRIGSGSTETAGNFWFNGSVDEVAVYNTVLSGARVAEHYLAGRFGALDPMRHLFLADFRNPPSTGLGGDAARMVAAGQTTASPTRTNPDGMLVLGGGGTGGFVFVNALPGVAFSEPLIVGTQAFFSEHNAPASGANAYFGLIALHQQGIASSGPGRRGGLFGQWEPLTNNTGNMRLGFQTDSTGTGDDLFHTMFERNVSGFTNANGIFDLRL